MRRTLRCLGPILLALVVAVAVQGVVPSCVSAQQEQEDVVYLKDGSVLRGTIIEDIPGESLLIETRDGNRFRISYDRIERRTREPRVAVAPPTVAETSQPRAPITTGRKDPYLAFFLSVVVTGTGQGYNGQWGKAAVMAGGFWTSFLIARGGADNCFDVIDDAECGQFAGGLLGMFGIWMWSWIDAPISANAINTRLALGIALEVGPRPQLGFQTDALARQISRGRSSPQIGVSLARFRF